MITSTIHIDDRFAQVTAQIERLAAAAVEDAAIAAAERAQAGASIPLELQLHHAAADGSAGYSAGIKSRKASRWSTAPIAVFFDKGTLGKRRGALAPRVKRKDTWTVNRRGSAHTAHRHLITDEMGVPAEGFFGKARAAGRAAMEKRLQAGPSGI